MELVVWYVSVFLEGRVEVLINVGGDYDSESRVALYGQKATNVSK